MVKEIRSQSRRDQVMILVFAVLIVYNLSILILEIAGIPRYYQRATTQMVEPIVQFGEVQMSNETIVDHATALGLELPSYAALNILTSVVIMFGFVGAALLVLSKAGGNWFMWFTAFMLTFFPGGGTGLYDIYQVAYPHWLVFGDTGGLLWPAYGLFLYLFPNGKALPRWSRWPILGYVVVHFTLQASFWLGSLGLVNNIDWLKGLFPIILISLIFIVSMQVVRYRTIYTPIERQQTKWFVGGMVAWIGLDILVSWIGGNISSLSANSGWFAVIPNLLSLILPITLVISILRYRLWDIDVIIRKTLVYGALTAALAFVFFGGVTLLQQLFGTVTGWDNSPAAIVISTLAIAALFNPVRNAVQNFIDRRFYRQKYNAEQALARFASAARQETDLARLSAELLAVVEETMQPEKENLWLKPRPGSSWRTGKKNE